MQLFIVLSVKPYFMQWLCIGYQTWEIIYEATFLLELVLQICFLWSDIKRFSQSIFVFRCSRRLQCYFQMGNKFYGNTLWHVQLYFYPIFKMPLNLIGRDYLCSLKLNVWSSLISCLYVILLKSTKIERRFHLNLWSGHYFYIRHSL